MKHTFTTTLFLAMSTLGASDATWYVNGVDGNDGNNCVSAQAACKTIGHAISLAASGDSIKVAAATYKENLTIGITLKILGSGVKTTIIDGGGVATVVTISSLAAHVTLSTLTVTNGFANSRSHYGGGIFNSGILTLNNSIVTGNQAVYGGGIVSQGTLTINNSTISNNTSSHLGCILHNCVALASGGGIGNQGTLTINNSTISGNTAVSRSLSSLTYAASTGAGIENQGTLIINNSTIAFNSATSSGPGNSAYGGGVYNSGSAAGKAVLKLSNSTLARNTLSGFVASGAGVSNNDAEVTTKNTIFANNSPGGNCDTTLTSNGYNLSNDSTCHLAGPGDMNSTGPKLGALGNYGGPTQTIPLLSGSPAIDAGNPSGCTNNVGHLLKTDQRGYPRPDKEDTGACDIGAYELQSD